MKPRQVGWDEGFEEASRRAAATTLEVARRRGLVDIGYTTVDTPVGTLFVASTGKGLVRLAFPEEPFDHVLEELAETLSPGCSRTRSAPTPPADSSRPTSRGGCTGSERRSTGR